MLPLLLLAIGLPIAISLLIALLPGRWARHLALAGPASVLMTGAGLWRRSSIAPQRASLGQWVPSLGVDIGFVVDRFGVFFLLLIGIVGLAVVQYARAYFGPRARRSFWSLLLLFTGAMTGLVVSDDLVLFYVFWELTTVSSALLIAGHGASAEARRGAVQAFLVTGIGGLSLLAGIILLDQVAGTLDFTSLAGNSDRLVSDPRHFAVLGLMLVGAFAKSAQFPFHFWLPGAMAAPTPVSAYLHSATMVQAGIVLVARLYPGFGGSPLWLPLLTTVGLTTYVVAGWSALRSWDLKRLLAFSTAAYLGLVMAYYGYAGSTGRQDDLMLIANHALYKSALFLLVGWIEKVTGTRDLRTLAPERWVQHVPFGAVLFGIGVLAMAGVPLLLGFVSKELFLAALLGGGSGTGFERWGPILATTTANAFAFAYALKFGAVFFGREPPPLDRGHPLHSVSRWLIVIPAILLLPQVIGGIAPRWLAIALEPGSHIEGGLAIWHHLDLELVLSLAGYALGALLFLVWQPIARSSRVPGFDALAGASADGALRASAWLSRRVQVGGHPRFLSLITFFAAAASVGAVLSHLGAGWPTLAQGPDRLLAWIPLFLVLAGTGGTLALRNRFAKVVAIGIVGYGIALFYALFRAPDLVLTQVLVESLSLVLVLLAFARLPSRIGDARTRGQKTTHALVGLGLGGLLGLLVLSASSAPAPSPSGFEQLALALPEGHGRNAVNVILVDFRGADTLGEIAVLAIAALGAIVLLRIPAREHGIAGANSLIMSGIARGVLPAALVFAAYLLWRGHDAPGGGFSGGLVAALAFALQTIALGLPARERAGRVPVIALSVSLLLAVSSASLGLLVGKPFFSHLWAGAPAPFTSTLSTTFLFDIGVFGAVVSAVSLFALALREGGP